MKQAKIEQLAFLYLCSEHDKRLLLKKEKMQLQETGCCVGNIGNTESEIKLHEMWIQDFCKNTPVETREWIQELDYR